ncbi:receptor-like protein 12 [Gossypium australe]|uniref:Receptor-like protein 12 n=1 Tax=Gossypium australe TaxID=47621 RepID=A0A5B6VIT5_9ROSI|nr:receptor-like protein 12 [Gossypium australe]
MPERIISDNALNLNNSMNLEACNQFKIKHHNSSPYRPKMNDAVKAANKNIKKIISMRSYHLPSMPIEHLSEPPSGQHLSLRFVEWKPFCPLKSRFLPSEFCQN